eukprot:1152526-Pelagomonas_calceolata.AAC.6
MGDRKGMLLSNVCKAQRTTFQGRTKANCAVDVLPESCDPRSRPFQAFLCACNTHAPSGGELLRGSALDPDPHNPHHIKHGRHTKRANV